MTAEQRVRRGWGTARSRLGLLAVAIVAFALCAVGGATLNAALGGRPTSLDASLYAFVSTHRSPALLWPSLFLNQFGGGDIAQYVVPVIAAVILVFFRGFWAAIILLPLRPVTQWAVNELKGVFERPRPSHQEVAVTLSAYPSGHSAVAACLVIVLALLIRRTWFWVVGTLYVVAMGFSRMYLNVHWFTDILGGTALGIAIGILFWASAGAVRSLLTRRMTLGPPPGARLAGRC